MPSSIKCRHCGHKVVKRRGLCKKCYMDLEIRNLYPALHDHSAALGDQTMEEIEATIAEQEKVKPGWYDRSSPIDRNK